MVLAVGAMAQGGGRGGQRGFGRFGQQSPTSLLRRTDVKEDLKLTDDQKSKLADVQQKQQEKMRDAFQNSGIQFQPGTPPSAEDQKKLQDMMTKLNEENTKEINAILDADQQKRLKEIFVQFQGNAIAGNADYQKDLGITDDQKAKIAELQKKQGEAMQALFQKMRDQEIDRQGFTEATEKNTKIMNDEIGKILTDDQKKKIADWSGKPFVKKDQPGGRGGGGL
ncbi:Spy/CpxP family protein refolding chaperone [Fimbriimonas ginsengisoli]|nr:Spy/CpxP family protein refolding chaperone [Fimbriimonas ginsengisoli]